jgi:predicted nucleic acid-binding protein
MRVYLDNCCFNRPFDDQNQLRIRLDAEAKLGVQEKIMEGRIELAWSYILDFENTMNPFEQRKMVIFQWRTHAAVHAHETDGIREKAENLVQQGLKSKDALHLACAIALECEYLLTTDDHLIKKSYDLKDIKVVDPITFVREELE